MNEKVSDWLVRFQLAFVTGLVVAALAYLCAWFQYRDFHYYRFNQIRTRDNLELLRQDIDWHRQTTGKVLATLEELDVVKVGHAEIRDDWGRPLHYQINGDSYLLFSYGRDGQPGGEGLDADLYAGTPPMPTEMLTLWQFSSAPGVQGIMVACLLAGLAAMPIYFMCSVKKAGPDRRSFYGIIAANIVTALFSILVAVEMSVLHLPSGH